MTALVDGLPGVVQKVQEQLDQIAGKAQELIELAIRLVDVDVGRIHVVRQHRQRVVDTGVDVGALPLRFIQPREAA